MWNSIEFFRRCSEKSRLARDLGFQFEVISGLDSFESLLADIIDTDNFICASDSGDGVLDIDISPDLNRTHLLFFAMRHEVGDMDARSRCLDIMRTLFTQFMSRLIPEKSRIAEDAVYIDPRIRFTEIDRWFFNGAACAYAQITVRNPVDLSYDPSQWLD